MAISRSIPRTVEPKLIFGLVLILGSALAGWLLVMRMDSHETYWAVARSIEPGESVNQSDFTQVRAQVPTDAGFVKVNQTLPAEMTELTWARSLASGSMVTTGDFVIGGGSMKAEVPLNVAVGAFPADLQAGDTVDIWVAPSKESGLIGDAEKVMSAVTVLSVGSATQDIGLGTTIVIGLRDNPDGSQLGIIAAGDVIVVRVR